MISLEYIKAETKFHARLEDGSLCVGTYDWLRERTDLEGFDKAEKLDPEGQPLKVRSFWLAYRRAVQEGNRKDLAKVDDFYAEWAKNPEQFGAPKRQGVGDLKGVLERYGDCPEKTSFKLSNYDGYFIGAHGREDFEKALEEMGEARIDVASVTEYSNRYTRRLTVSIVTQCDDLGHLQDLAVLSNKFMADRIFPS